MSNQDAFNNRTLSMNSNSSISSGHHEYHGSNNMILRTENEHNASSRSSFGDTTTETVIDDSGHPYSQSILLSEDTNLLTEDMQNGDANILDCYDGENSNLAIEFPHQDLSNISLSNDNRFAKIFIEHDASNDGFRSYDDKADLNDNDHINLTKENDCATLLKRKLSEPFGQIPIKAINEGNDRTESSCNLYVNNNITAFHDHFQHHNYYDDDDNDNDAIITSGEAYTSFSMSNKDDRARSNSVNSNAFRPSSTTTTVLDLFEPPLKRINSRCSSRNQDGRLSNITAVTTDYSDNIILSTMHSTANNADSFCTTKMNDDSGRISRSISIAESRNSTNTPALSTTGRSTPSDSNIKSSNRKSLPRMNSKSFLIQPQACNSNEGDASGDKDKGVVTTSTSASKVIVKSSYYTRSKQPKEMV